MKKYAAAFFLTFIFLTANAQETMNEKDKLTYAHGIMLAKELQSQKLTDINMDKLMEAVNDYKNGSLKITEAEAMKLLNDYNTKMMAAEGEAFLAENGKREGVITTDSGLQYEILKSVESGPSPTLSNEVKTHYHGTLIDGTVFDSSVDRGEPISFPLANVIKGWQEALQLMKVGEKFKVYLPYQLAYGARGAGAQIKPYAALVFEVELLGIK